MAIAFRQSNSTAGVPSSASINCTYNLSQVAGNTNIVVIGMIATTTTIVSVSDTSGNTYSVAAPLTTGSGLSQVIYYANNINTASAGANAVSVVLSAVTAWPDLRIHEYSGLRSTASLDVFASASGSSTTPDSGSTSATGVADELLFAAGISVGSFTAPGAGFTQRELNANDALSEDRIVSSIGSYNATATATNNSWVMQIATFKQAISVVSDQAQFFRMF